MRGLSEEQYRVLRRVALKPSTLDDLGTSLRTVLVLVRWDFVETDGYRRDSLISITDKGRLLLK